MNLLKMPGLIRSRQLPWLFIGLVLIFALVVFPSMVRSDNGIQIRASSQGIMLPDGFYVYQRLNEHGIHIKSITPDRDSLVIRFDSPEQSVAAERLLRQLLPYGFDIGQLEGAVSAEGQSSQITQRT
ncbi:EnvZ/OmpR regulon moderator MzrA [Izhakiella australiensis]|nr:EnvZ/OmpR regulon moderator MzrA [Izhakiella australiensis]